MFYFATLEFPSFMDTFPTMKRVPRKIKPIAVIGTDVFTIVHEEDAINNKHVFEYASDKTYVHFSCSETTMALEIKVKGETKVKTNFNDFSEVKDMVKKYV